MATPAQIAANRANAQMSTGPRSAEGKSASRFNALKHGIDAASIVIPGEDPAEYDALAADYLSDFRPQSPSEFFHLETMLRADWQKCRTPRRVLRPPPPPRLLRRQAPRPRPAPDRRLRTHLVPRQHRTPPPPQAH